MGLGTLYCKAQSTAHLGLNELCPCLNYMTLWAAFHLERGRPNSLGGPLHEISAPSGLEAGLNYTLQ
jgi:hypothetical protein